MNTRTISVYTTKEADRLIRRLHEKLAIETRVENNTGIKFNYFNPRVDVHIRSLSGKPEHYGEIAYIIECIAAFHPLASLNLDEKVSIGGFEYSRIGYRHWEELISTDKLVLNLMQTERDFREAMVSQRGKFVEHTLKYWIPEARKNRQDWVVIRMNIDEDKLYRLLGKGRKTTYTLHQWLDIFYPVVMLELPEKTPDCCEFNLDADEETIAGEYDQLVRVAADQLRYVKQKLLTGDASILSYRSCQR